MKLIIGAASAAATLLILDAVWLTLMASTYRRLFAGQLVEPFRMAPAAAFYVLYLFGLMALVVAPALEYGSDYVAVALRGALLGLVAYGTYALTNYATLKVYGPQLAVMDLCWGPLLTGLAAVAAVAAARQFGG